MHIVIHPFFSKCAAWYYHSKFSKKKISSFIENYEIDMGIYEEKAYESFNDFFIRKLNIDELEKRKAFFKKNGDTKNCSNAQSQKVANYLISPAHSKLSVYPIDSESLFEIKHSIYSLEDLLEDEKLAREYQGGSALVFRLSVSDYHRYAFVQSGEIVLRRKIKGCLHTVSSFSSKYPVYIRNSREYSVIRGQNGKEMIQMEIGAILVGKMQNHEMKNAQTGEEKGYFEFGASTIILLFQKDTIALDRDILEVSKEQVEIKVDYLEKIGFFK